MRIPLIRTAILGVALVLGGCKGSHETGPSGAPSGAPAGHAGKHVSVIVGEDGFSPSQIHATKGEPLMLMFKRTAQKTCATAVEFPELKIKKELPLNQEVAIDIPTGQSRTLVFQCGMGMYKSSVVIQ